MQTILTQLEREDLKNRHKKERDKRICDRIKAVLLHDKGWNYDQIAEVLLLDNETVRLHIRDYQSVHKLKPENGGSQEKLTELQNQKLLDHLEKHTYLHAKDIIAYIKVTFNVEYTVAGMTYYLKAHGFSYKKPAVVPGKVNLQAQKEWLEKYGKLKESLPPNDAICFIDGVHPTHNTKITYGWIKKGSRKEMPTNTGRQRLNIAGAIDINSKKVTTREDSTLNASATIEFLKKLEESYPLANQVHVFCDNARYYKNKEVSKFLEKSKIKIHFLPPYSPNLNPIERLWKLMNENVLYNRYYEKFESFKKAVFEFLEKLVDPKEEILSILKNRITDNFRVMGSNSA